MTATRHRLCHSDELGEGTSRGFDPTARGRDTLFVVKQQGAVYAYEDECPHVAGGRMAWRKDAYMDASGTKIICYAHGAVFVPETGLCIKGPCLGQFLKSIPIHIGAEGNVWLDE
jgi:nitrite reductase/ring-hydroxylating ferredoxin subunit